LAAALALGAQGVWLGTRFIASKEAHAGGIYKDAVVAARDVDTVRTRSYSGKPMRVKDNAWVKDWESRPSDIQAFPMQAMVSMQAGAMGGIGGQTEGLDPDRSCFAMGQSAGGVQEILSSKEIVDTIIADAVAAIERIGRLRV
jgi:enoyl-[acyl-carrier protein] reductase II